MSQPHDSVYYMNYKRFLVEGYLFQIPIDSLIAQSSFFHKIAERLMTPNLKNEPPMHLLGVSKDDFRQLLKVIHPQLPPDVFRVGICLEAGGQIRNGVKKHAITSMNKLPNADIDLVEKIVVARTYDIESWLVPTFNAILQRPQSFTEHDLERLGASTLLHLVALRDRLRPLFDTGSSLQLGNRREPNSVDFTKAIQDAWPNLQGGARVVKNVSKEPLLAEYRFSSDSSFQTRPPESCFKGLAPIKGLPNDPATGA